MLVISIQFLTSPPNQASIVFQCLADIFICWTCHWHQPSAAGHRTFSTRRRVRIRMSLVLTCTGWRRCHCPASRDIEVAPLCVVYDPSLHSKHRLCTDALLGAHDRWPVISQDFIYTAFASTVILILFELTTTGAFCGFSLIQARCSSSSQAPRSSSTRSWLASSWYWMTWMIQVISARQSKTGPCYEKNRSKQNKQT